MKKPSELNPAFAITWGKEIDLAEIKKNLWDSYRTGENPLHLFVYELVTTATNARETLQHWAQEFVTDPAYKMEYCDGAMTAAAEFKFTMNLIMRIRSAQDTATIERIAGVLQEEALRRARHFNSSSSSAASNTMERLQLNVTAEWSEKANRFVASAQEKASKTPAETWVALAVDKSGATAIGVYTSQDLAMTGCVDQFNDATDGDDPLSITWTTVRVNEELHGDVGSGDLEYQVQRVGSAPAPVAPEPTRKPKGRSPRS